MSYLPSHEGIISMSQLQLSRWDLLKPYKEFIDRLMSYPAGLAAYWSLPNSCAFCYGAHKSACMALGVDEALFQKLVDDLDGAPVDEKLKPILKYAKKLTLTPSRLTDEDAKACYRAGWSEQDLTIAITVVASWNWFNRMILGHGIDKKWNEALFRDRGAPEKMAHRYKAYYDEMVAKGMADRSGPRRNQPPRV